MGLQSEIAQRLAEVQQRLHEAVVRSGRQPGDVRLLVVSKTFSLAHIRAAAAAGQTDFLLRPHQLGHAGQIFLEGHAIGTTVTYDSPAFNVSGGQQIEWTLESDVTRSTVAVY